RSGTYQGGGLGNSGYFHFFGRTIGPVLPPFGALVHPFGQQVDLFPRKFWFLVGHAHFGVLLVQALDERAPGSTAGDNGRDTRFGDRKGLLLEQQAEVPALLNAPVTG